MFNVDFKYTSNIYLVSVDVITLYLTHTLHIHPIFGQIQYTEDLINRLCM